MPAALAALTLGAILIVAGIQNRNVIDVALGRQGKMNGSTADEALDKFGVTSKDLTSLPDLTPGPTDTLPKGTGTFDGRAVAKWIIPRLQWARANGYWHGQVTSGWRDPKQVVTPSPGLPVAPQGKSNHNTTTYPGGAVDVSDPDGLEEGMRHYPGFPKLKRGTAIGDPIHFSATGR